MCIQGFNALKMVFPGRINLSRRDPGSVDSSADPRVSQDARETSAYQAAEVVRTADSADSELAEQTSTSQRVALTYEDSRIRKFTNILTGNMVDLQALQSVSALSVHQPIIVSTSATEK
jgi:hypothetical protein